MRFVFMVFVRTTTSAFWCHHQSSADVAAADAIYVHPTNVNNNNNNSRIRLSLISRSTSSHRPSPPPLSLFPLPLKLKIIFSCTTSSSSLPPQQLMRSSSSRPPATPLPSRHFSYLASPHPLILLSLQSHSLSSLAIIAFDDWHAPPSSSSDIATLHCHHILVLLLLLLFILAAGIAFHCCNGDYNYRHNLRDCNVVVIMPITPFAVAVTVQSPSPMTVIIHTIPPRFNDPTLFSYSTKSLSTNLLWGCCLCVVRPPLP